MLVAAAACSGTIEDPNADGALDPDAPREPAAGSGEAGRGTGGSAAGSGAAGSGPIASDCTPGQPPATTRLARLTHHQYDNSIRAARELLFERNEPAVIVMDYGTHPERAWMYQYEGTAWAMPKSRVYRAGRFRFREVGASLN